MPKKRNPEDIIRPERSYTLEEKEEAIALVFKNDSVATASRMTGIPNQTIHGWLKNIHRDGELGVIREAIRVKVVEKAWSGTLRAIASLIREHDRLAKSRGDDAEAYEPTVLVDLANVAEKMTRVLKNIGDVAQKMEMTGEVRHLLEKVGADGMTTDKFIELGYAAQNKRLTGLS